MNEEIAAIKAKYAAQKSPIFAKRLAFVSGAEEPTKEDVPEDTEVEKEALKTAAPAALPAGGDAKGVPGFWLQALQNFGQLQEVASGWCSIQERDQPALAYLTDVRVSKDDAKGFQVEFEFRENPYFTNKVLSKTYHLSASDEPGLGDDQDFSHSEGTRPEWKAKQDLTVKSVQKKVKNRRKGGHTVQTVQENCESFFQFFNTLSLPEDEELDEEEVRHACFQNKKKKKKNQFRIIVACVMSFNSSYLLYLIT
jgi:nucleosome assembly protein 1-like 1